MGLVDSALAPLNPARHLPGPTIGLDAPFQAATARPALFLEFSDRRGLRPFGRRWELDLASRTGHAQIGWLQRAQHTHVSA